MNDKIADNPSTQTWKIKLGLTRLSYVTASSIPCDFFKLKFKWNLITTKWCSYTCINNLSARDHSAGSMDIRDSFAAWKSMLSLFGKIHLFICVNCVWMDHKSEILMLKEIETVPTLKHPPAPKSTLLYSLANDKIMSLDLMTYSLFVNIVNPVKDEFTGLTKIHHHST